MTQTFARHYPTALTIFPIFYVWQREAMTKKHAWEHSRWRASGRAITLKTEQNCNEIFAIKANSWHMKKPLKSTVWCWTRLYQGELNICYRTPKFTGFECRKNKILFLHYRLLMYGHTNAFRICKFRCGLQTLCSVLCRLGHSLRRTDIFHAWDHRWSRGGRGGRNRGRNLSVVL